MKKLAPGVYLLGEDGYRAYLLQTAEGNILIDTPSPVAETLTAVEELGGAQLLFITHRDDMGDACAWKEEWDVEIAMHGDDAFYLRECDVDRELDDGEELTGDTRVIHLPGHSPGSCALFFTGQGGILFTGDALVTTGENGLALPPARYSNDISLATDSLRRLLDYEFEVIFPAHGPPIMRGAKRALENLVTTLRQER